VVASGFTNSIRGRVDEFEAHHSLASGLGLRTHAHAGLDPEDRGVISEIAGRGLLGPDVTLIHCTMLSDSDLDAISSAGAQVALAPSSEMAGRLGSPPIQKLIDRDIRPGLAIDSEVMTPGDMFAQMRATISLQHATYFDLRLAGKAGLPNLMTTRDVIRYATVDGARVAGLGAVAGSLEPGKHADILILRADRPNIAPVNDPIGAVVWGMDTSNVDWVFVGGKVLMRDGVIQGDLDRARHLAMSARARVLESAGAMTPAGGGS